MTDDASAHLDGIARHAAEGLNAFTDFGASNIFGAPVVAGTRTVIPVAAFEIGAGFGFGGGGDGQGSGGGGGGGGYTQGRPVAVIEITESGVRIQPMFDWTRVGLVALTTAFAVWRRTRRT